MMYVVTYETLPALNENVGSEKLQHILVVLCQSI